MVNPKELLKKFHIGLWYGKQSDLSQTVVLTNEEMCYLFAQLGTAIGIEEWNKNKQEGR